MIVCQHDRNAGLKFISISSITYNKKVDRQSSKYFDAVSKVSSFAPFSLQVLIPSNFQLFWSVFLVRREDVFFLFSKLFYGILSLPFTEALIKGNIIEFGEDSTSSSFCKCRSSRMMLIASFKTLRRSFGSDGLN